MVGGETEGEGREVRERLGDFVIMKSPPPLSLSLSLSLSDFSTVLTELHWPFSSSSISYSLVQQNQSFSQLFGLLLQLDPLSPLGGRQNQGNHGENMDDPLLYPVEQLVQPLRRRFRYHFVEERQTNSLEKVSGGDCGGLLTTLSSGPPPPQPEWCFTQVSSWIRSHTPFLEKLVQPLLDEAGLSHVDTVVSFI